MIVWGVRNVRCVMCEISGARRFGMSGAPKGEGGRLGRSGGFEAAEAVLPDHVGFAWRHHGHIEVQAGGVVPLREGALPPRLQLEG